MQEVVKGTVVLESKGGFSHNGITMVMEGVVTLQLSAKSVGLFEAFYNSLKPVPLAGLTIEVAKVCDQLLLWSLFLLASPLLC
jgi:hypothetical protein